jgi:hypothetical protein
MTASAPAPSILAPDESARRPHPWTPWLTLLACAGVLFARRPDALLHPQFYCEDGMIFFKSARTHGFASIFEVSTGYHQLFPHLIAYFGSLFNPRYAPFIYNLAAITAALSVAAHIFSRRVRLPFKPLLALAVAATPCLFNEIIANEVNTQWFLCLHLVLLALADDAVTAAQGCFDAFVLLLAGMTGPLAIAFLPLFVYRLWLRRTRASLLMLAGNAAISAVQMVLIVTCPWNRPELLNSLPFTIIGQDWAGYFGNGIAGLLLFGTRSREFLNISILLSVVTVLIVGALVFDAVKRRNHPILMFVFAAGAVMASSAYSYKGFVNGLALGAGCRYFFPVIVLLNWALIQTLNSRRWMAWSAGALLLWGAAASAWTCYTPPDEDHHWTQTCQLLDSPGSVMLPVTPGNNYFMTLENPDTSRAQAVETPLFAADVNIDRRWPDADKEAHVIQVALPSRQHATGLRLKYTLEAPGASHLRTCVAWSDEGFTSGEPRSVYAELIADGAPHMLTVLIDGDMDAFGLMFDGNPRRCVLLEAVRLEARD